MMSDPTQRWGGSQPFGRLRLISVFTNFYGFTLLLKSILKHSMPNSAHGTTSMMNHAAESGFSPIGAGTAFAKCVC